MIKLMTIAERILQGRRALETAAVLWGGALGVTGLALALGCPAEVLEGGLGGALGTALWSVAPGALMPQPLSWAGQGVAL